MTIYTANSSSEEWYIRQLDAVLSPPLAVVGQEDVYEFCFWTSHYELVCLLADLACVAGQTVWTEGGVILGVYYKHSIMVRVNGENAWMFITSLFDDWLLGPVWGRPYSRL